MEPLKMKFGTWFVAEISMSPSNPIFRSVCEYLGGNRVEIFAGEDRTWVDPTKLSFFRVVCEIKEMNCKFPNQYKLPPDCSEQLASLRVKSA